MSSAPGCHRPSLIALLAGALLLAAACEPEATPLPVLPVATTPAPEQTAEASARNTVMVDALTLRLLPEVVRERLDAVAEVVITADIAADGATGPTLSILPFAGGAPTGFNLPVAARLDLTQAPLDDAELAAALTGFLTARYANELRLALANAGFPDGVTLTVAVEPALWPLLQGGLSTGPVQWFPVAAGAPAQVTIAAGAEADAMPAEGGALIGSLPLYGAGWPVTLDAAGLPVFSPPAPG